MPTQTFEAVIDAHGNVQFPEPLRLPQGTKVTVTVEDSHEPEQAFDIPLIKPGSVTRIPSVRIVRDADAKAFMMKVTDVTDAAPGMVAQYEDIVAGLPGLAEGDKRVPAFRIEKIK